MTISDTLTQPPTVHVNAPLEAREHARRQLLRAAAVRHPGLAEVTQVCIDDGGVVATYAVPSNARAVQFMPPATSTDVVRLLAPVAAGLALLHDAGLVHGAVGVDRLWRCDLLNGILGPGPGVGDAPDDVHDFAALLESLLPDRSVGGDIAHLLIVAQDPEIGVRPSMARIAAVLDAADRRLHPPVSPPAQRRASYEPEGRASEATPDGLPTAIAVRSQRRARHAAPVGRPAVRLSWRVIAVALGVGAVAILGLGAVSGADVPAMCPAPPALSGVAE